MTTSYEAFRNTINKIAAPFATMFLLMCLVLTGGCKAPQPTITFTTIPEVSPGGPDTEGAIAGRVSHAHPGDELILFTQAGEWWVQPDVHTPYTAISPDGAWSSKTHLGRAYGAILVSAPYEPAQHLSELPAVGGKVLAVASVEGKPNPIESASHAARPIRFGGYDWHNDYQVASLHNIYRYYLPANAEVDGRGALHLHIRTSGNERTCALVSLGQTLGYGNYKLKLDVPTKIDPAAELNIFTSNNVENPGEHREIEFHLSRWGDPANQNAEYVIQPDHIAGNVHHFSLEPGPVLTDLQWSPGKADLSSTNASNGKEETHWSFTSGVPLYRNQRLYMSFCPFPYPKFPYSKESEVVLENFEFTP